MGKSLNLDTLRTFLDCTQNTGELFKGLYIESSSVWEMLNKYPVIYLDFKDLILKDYKQRFRNLVRKFIKKYLPIDQLDDIVKEYYITADFSTAILCDLSEALYNYYGVKPYIIIDEYDNLFMSSIGNSGFDDFRGWLRDVLSSALKGNRFLEKAVLTGVNRIAQESLFSGLNNITVYDVFTPSKFDTDFGLTEEEVAQLIPDIEERKRVREWYNGFRVGNSEVYNIYSVTSYLAFHEFDNYWGMSGVMHQFKRMLTPSRQEKLGNILAGKPVIAEVEPRLTYDALVHAGKERTFWGLAVQTGYLAYDPVEGYRKYTYYLRLSGLELKEVWVDFILDEIYTSTRLAFQDALAKLPDFSDLGEIISGYLSFYDFDFQEHEKTYHVAVLFLFSALGYKITSNRESGLGRYDVLLELPKFSIIFEFKVAESETPVSLRLAAEKALAQIDEREYWRGCNPELPLYKIGIGFFGKRCSSISVLHDGAKK
jgi:hypothetical protein